MAESENNSGEQLQTNEALALAAQDEIASVMQKAMGNMSNNSTDQTPKNTSPTEELSTEYVQPMQDPYNKAITYLENHNILQLFQQLTASIVYTKPEQPLDFMMQEVEKMKKEKAQEQKS
ncbi:hypothetical protein ACF0H5_016679 [Mactra antiquata]